jgi:hypothetical protein
MLVDCGRGTVSHPEATRQVMAEAVPADRLGVDFFGVDEHHRDASRSRRGRSCSPPSRTARERVQQLLADDA